MGVVPVNPTQNLPTTSANTMDNIVPVLENPNVGTPFGMDWQVCEGEITENNIPDIYELLQLLWVV